MRMSVKTVIAKVQIQRHRRSEGLSIAQLHTEHLPDHLDPFLAFDHFEMAQPFFPPHPHAGFSAVTYMFPQSENGFVNRDSLGDRIEIHPGDLHWTGAGRGVMHEEVPIRRGVVCHGLQIFVNLHSSKKWMAPQILHQNAADVLRITSPAGEIRVVVGAHGEHRSPIDAPTNVTLLDIVLSPNGTFEHQVPLGESRFVYVIEGNVNVGPSSNSVRLVQGSAAGLSARGDIVALSAGEKGAHVIVAGGKPLDEPIVSYGPFCMNTQEEILRVIQDYKAGKMGHLDPSF